MRTIMLIAIVLAGCGGPAIDREGTLTQLHSAIQEDVSDPTQLENHNELVERVSRGNVLEGMRQNEVEAAIGRGQECGTRELCSRQGFEPTDWVYEVGQQDGLPSGPTLIVGFDRQGFVTGTYTLARHPARPAP